MAEIIEQTCINCDNTTYGLTLFVTHGRGTQSRTYCPDCADDFTTCDNCSEACEVSESTTFNNDVYCEACRDESLGYCEACEETCIQEDMQEANSERNHTIFICEHCYRNDYFSCSSCSSVFSTNVSCESSDDSDRYCGECFWEHHFACEECNDNYHNDAANYDEEDNGPFCESCYSEGERACRNTFTQSKSFILNKHARFVGYELEFVADVRKFDSSKLGVFKDDASVKPNENQPNKYAHEFASKAANGDDLFNGIDSITKRIKESGGEINTTCGFHVHVDMRDLKMKANESKRLDPNVNLFYWFIAFERVFCGMVSDSRRSNTYCKMYNNIEPKFNEASRDRYRTLNTASLSEHGTYEYRLHQGTLDAKKIKNWISLLLEFTEVFSQIDINETRFQEVFKLKDRDKLLLFFSLCKLPLTLKKYMVKRMKELSANYFDLTGTKVYHMPENTTVSAITPESVSITYVSNSEGDLVYPQFIQLTSEDNS